MKLWVDDLRPAPEGWRWAKSSAVAVGMLSYYGAGVKEISLDHDLGDEDTTRRVVLWMCERKQWPDVVRVHTANPVGREWLVGMAERYGPGVTRD